MGNRHKFWGSTLLLTGKIVLLLCFLDSELGENLLVVIEESVSFIKIWL